MIWITIAVVLAAVAYWQFFRKEETPVTIKTVTEKAKDVADVNNDGKVDLNDAKAAVDEAKAAIKKVKKKYGGKVKKTK